MSNTKRLAVIGFALVAVAVIFPLAASALVANPNRRVHAGWVEGTGAAPITAGKILNAAATLDDALGGGSETTSTVFNVSGGNSLTLFFDFDEVAPDAVTDVSWECETGIDAAGTGGWKRIVGGAYAAGVETVAAVRHEYAITADGDWQYVYTVNAEWMRCRFDAAGATDTKSNLTVHAWLGVL